MYRFEGKVVGVTGGARGIGRACAIRFAKEGARVAVFDVDEPAARTVADEIGGMPIHCDVRSQHSVQAAIGAALEAWGRIDVLYANAGVFHSASLAETELKDWQFLVDVNLTGTMFCCQAAAPAMIEQKTGSIIIASSMAAKTSWPAQAAYSATKTGLLGLMRSLAQELAPFNVNCNAVCPGHFDTDMLRSVDRDYCEQGGWEPGTFISNMARDNPMRRLGRLEEIAALVAFLASDEARYINGQAIEIDGGLVMS